MERGERAIWLSVTVALVALLVGIVVSVLLHQDSRIDKLERWAHSHDFHRELPP